MVELEGPQMTSQFRAFAFFKATRSNTHASTRAHARTLTHREICIIFLLFHGNSCYANASHFIDASLLFISSHLEALSTQYPGQTLPWYDAPKFDHVSVCEGLRLQNVCA